jgi:hypothetical protein
VGVLVSAMIVIPPHRVRGGAELARPAVAIAAAVVAVTPA